MGLLDQIDPRDVKQDVLLVSLAAGGVGVFAGAAVAIATKHRYLLAYSCHNRSNAAFDPITLEDQNGNDLVTFGGFQRDSFILNMPMIVGIPGQNGLQIRNIGAGAAQNFCAWVQFADLSSQLTKDIFRS